MRILRDSPTGGPGGGDGDATLARLANIAKTGLVVAAAHNDPLAIAAALGGHLIEEIVAPAVSKRRDDYLASLDERIGILEERGIDVTALSRDDQFVDAVASCCAAALRSNHQRRREALRNVAIRAALPSRPDAIKQQLMVELLDGFTDGHIVMLEAFRNPSGWLSSRPHPPKVTAVQLGAMILGGGPGSDTLAQQIWRALFRADMVLTPELENGPEGNTPSSRIAPFGEEFLNFIKDPLA